jgi:hypothetical protein
MACRTSWLDTAGAPLLRYAYFGVQINLAHQPADKPIAAIRANFRTARLGSPRNCLGVKAMPETCFTLP